MTKPPATPATPATASTVTTAPNDALEAMFDAFTDKLNMMLAACHNDGQANQIRAQYHNMLNKYYIAIDKAFQANDAGLQDLVTQANAAADVLTKIDAQLGTFTKILDAATTAAMIAGKIAAVVA